MKAISSKGKNAGMQGCCQTLNQSGMGGYEDNQRPPSRWRRGREIAGWIIPGTILALMPKCPICLAAYVALATGIGLSLPTAVVLRTGLVVGCVSTLAFVVGRRVWRVFRRLKFE